MKKVFIGTISSNATVSAYYLTSIFNTQKLLSEKNINCQLDIIVNEPLIQLARNKLLYIFLNSDCDQIIFIDSDQAWDANDLLRLVESDKDFIGAPIIIKNSNNAYNVSFKNKSNDDILEVESVGTGMLKVSRTAAQKIFDFSESYLDNEDSLYRMAFEVAVVDGNIVSEDLMFCKKWKDLGGKIFIDTSIDPYHIGNAVFKGNFKEYLN
jgi:hypothetical protein